jgi:ATP-dependent Clp protease protease subunit
MMPQDRIIQEMCTNSPMRDRRIFLNEEIDRDSIFKLVYWLDRLESIDKKTNTKQPIEIVIDSYGGSVYHTLSAISKIRSMVNKGYNIITTVHSIAFSGGFWILISGSERRGLINSRIMVHNIISGTQGKHQDMIDDIQEVDALWQKLKSIVVSNTNISDEKMEELKKLKCDYYFWGEEAVEDNLKVLDYLI